MSAGIDPYEGMTDDELDRHFSGLLTRMRLLFRKRPHVKQPPSDLSRLVAKVVVWIGRRPKQG